MLFRVAIFCAVALVVVKASCYGGYAQVNARTKEVSCVVDGERLRDGETRVTASCFECSCSEHGYNCCGVGYNAGHIGAPPGYKVVTDANCGYHFEIA